MTVVNSRHTLNINVSSAREHWLEGILRHEIGVYESFYYKPLSPLCELPLGLQLNSNQMICSTIYKQCSSSK